MSDAGAWRATPADAARIAAVLGLFAAVWFGWAAAGASPAVSAACGAGSGAAVLVALGAGYVSYRTRSAPSAVAGDPAAARRYGIVIAVEVRACLAGAVILGGSRAADWIPVWIAAVVGAHFLPLAPVLHDPWLTPLAVVLLGVAAAGAVAEAATGAAASTVVGAGSGLALGGFAALKLRVAVRGSR